MYTTREKVETLLKVENLNISFERYDHRFDRVELEVIKDMNIAVKKGEILAVVGASGSGKSLLAHGILGILPANSKMTGTIEFMGEKLTKSLIGEKRGKEIVLIPQSVNFLDPLMTVGRQVMGKSGDREKMTEIFKRLGLEQDIEKLYPFQLSGGMARRLLIATALMGTPRLVIADEPTPGLEISRAKETLSEFRKMADQGCGVLLITHDVDLALNVADRIAVFYDGTTIEIGHVDDFRKNGSNLRHPYSRALINALPQNKFTAIDVKKVFDGQIEGDYSHGTQR